MDRDILKRKIEFLVKVFYFNFSFLRDIPLYELQKKAVDKYLDSGMTIEEIQEELENEVIRLRKKSGNAPLSSDNHQNIYDRLEELGFMLNKANIDYRISGGLVGYLKDVSESERDHDNINIYIKEDDYDKFKEICNSLGIKCNEPSDEVFVSANLFQRLDNGTVITKKVDGDEINNEEIFNSEMADIVFGDDYVNFRGNKLKVIAPEYIYYQKSKSNLDKDKIDAEFMRNNIDQSKLKKIKDLKDDKMEVNDNSINELDSMVEDINHDVETIREDVNSNVNGGRSKTFTKNNNSQKNESGYADTSTVSSISALAIIVTIICLVFMYLTSK